jgi:hypothetical protein
MSKILEDLKKREEIKRNLKEEIVVLFTAEEVAILDKKLEGLSVTKGELIREYLLTTTALKVETKNKPKSKPRGSE